MKTRFYQFSFILLLLTAAWFCAPHGVKADKISDKKNEIQQLQQEIQSTQTVLSQKSEQVNTLKDQVTAMDSQIHQTELQISKTQNQADQTQFEIDDLNSQIATKETELKNRKNDLFETARVVYETGSPSALEIMVGSNSLSEIVDKSQYLDSINQQVQNKIAEINQIKADLETKKNEQIQKKQDLGELLSQQKDFQSGLQDQKSNKDQLLTQTKGQEAQYQKILAQKQAQWDQSNAELRQMEGGAIGVAGSYKLATWPMYGRLGVPFGACGCQAYFCGKCHTGVDIIAPSSTEIKAVKEGIVTSTLNSCKNHIGLNVPWSMIVCGGGYGNHVKIKSKDGFTQIYGHMTTGSVKVSVGQTVKAGTLLGREGSSGYSTGYHLHFEVRNPAGIPVGPSLP